MNNNSNRNNNNRRRGRNNRNSGGGGQPTNRIDSRARGNAPQMLEKYRKLAQDAQHHGDRVQAEYYLQFADHYFRVIADTKSRQEEARGRRPDERDERDDDSDSDDGFDGGRRHENANRRPRAQQDGRHDGPRDARQNERRPEPRDSDEDASSDPYEPAANPFVRQQEAAVERPRRTRTRRAEANDGPASIDMAALPPAIGTKATAPDDGAPADAADAPPAPRRRRRRPDDIEPVSAVG